MNILFGNAPVRNSFSSFILIGLMALCAGSAFAGDWRRHTSPETDVWHNGFFISEKKGWLISHNSGLILQTADGGESWKIQARVATGYLESIFFRDEKNGWLAGDRGRIYRTEDGGDNWVLYDSFNKSNAFYVVRFFNRRRGFAAGIDSVNRKGIFVASDDGGVSWRSRAGEIGVSESLADAAYFFGDKRGILFGLKTTVQTENGGREWRIYKTNQSGTTLRGLFFINSKIGWAVGHQGLVLQTNDGQTWTRQRSFSKGMLRSVVFINKKVGYIAGNRDENNFALWKTGDGGKTWAAQGTGFPNLRRLILTKNKLWLIGEAGTILSLSIKN